MKTKSLLVAAAIASAAFSASAFAFNPKDSVQITPRVIDSSVVQPVGLPRSFVDSVISIEFMLDAEGRPHDVKLLHVSDTTLQRQVVAAFRQWRFDVQSADPKNATKRFILPLQIRAEG